MPEIQDYDGLAPSNSAAPPNGFPDGALGKQYPSIIRELMARSRRWHDDICGRLKATGTNGNYVVSTARGLDLARGAALRFRANHENPSAGPTLAVGETGQRPLTYADGSTIPAGAIKNGQLLDASIDLDNNRWNLSIMPGAAATSGGTVTGDKLSLQGETQGSVAIRAGSAWIASAAGTATQFFRGGANPGFATPVGLCLLAGRITSGTVFTPKAGLAHTATISRLGVGSYRLNVSPALPSGAIACASTNGVFRVVSVNIPSSTEISIGYARTADPSNAEDISGSQAVTVMVV